MLEIGQSSNKGEKEESRLEEDSATLEAVLPYLYAKSVPVVEITDFSFILKMIKCCDKYQVRRFQSLRSSIVTLTDVLTDRTLS